jgi:hypothetical protein
MAEHDATYELGTATGTDLADHQKTYRGFLRLLKYCVAAIAIILILMAIFLA